MSKQIKLSKNFYAIVDDDDFKMLNQYNWYVNQKTHTNYAKRRLIKENDKVSTIDMHTQIMNTPKGMVIDHINGNGLDNRKENLRIVTPRQNLNNLKMIQLSVYPGVSWHKKTKKWRSQATIEGKRKHLGYFNSEIEAHKAYCSFLDKHNEEYLECEVK